MRCCILPPPASIGPNETGWQSWTATKITPMYYPRLLTCRTGCERYGDPAMYSPNEEPCIRANIDALAPASPMSYVVPERPVFRLCLDTRSAAQLKLALVTSCCRQADLSPSRNRPSARFPRNMDPITIAALAVAVVSALLNFTGPILAPLWRKIKRWYGSSCRSTSESFSHRASQLPAVPSYSLDGRERAGGISVRG